MAAASTYVGNGLKTIPNGNAFGGPLNGCDLVVTIH